MSLEDEPKEKHSMLGLLIWITPALLLPMIADGVTTSIPEIVINAILGGIGGVIGFVLYYFSLHKSQKAKCFILAGILISSIVSIVWMSSSIVIDQKSFLTCEICGYKTLDNLGGECDICLVSISDEYKIKEGYSSLGELKREEQLYFFAMEDDISIYGPPIYSVLDARYQKDTNWLCLVPSEEIESLRKGLE